jgi:hypothetical protein
VAPVRQLLAWYEATIILRLLVRRLPFGSGDAVDVALLATLRAMDERAMLVKAPAED